MSPTSPDALAPTAPAEPNDRGPGFFYEVPVIGRAKDHRVVLGGPPRVPDWQEGKWKPKPLPARPPPEDYGDVDVAELIRDLDEDARLQDVMPVRPGPLHRMQ